MNSNKCIVFARIGSNGNDPVKQAVSFSIQNEKAKHVAERLGLEIVKFFEQVGDDPQNEAQIELNKALAYCKSNTDVSYLFADSPARISRDVATFFYWKKMFDDQGVRLITVQSEKPGEESEVERFAQALTVALAENDRKFRWLKRKNQNPLKPRRLK